VAATKSCLLHATYANYETKTSLAGKAARLAAVKQKWFKRFCSIQPSLRQLLITAKLFSAFDMFVSWSVLYSASICPNYRVIN
jgi:hypothetical protein